MAQREPGKALSKVAGAVKRTASKVTARLRHTDGGDGGAVESKPLPRMATKSNGGSARRKRTEPDVPAEVLDRTYTPTQTSLKAGFRASGADRQRDQELSGGFADERWNDEDRLTNKSGDPRIGTHGRTYEPGE